MIKELRELANYLIRRFCLKPIDIQVRQVERGRARHRTRKITIPFWALEGVKEYGYYYFIHEICHFVMVDKHNYMGHGEKFKTLETEILKEHNIIPVYNKAYPRALYNLKGEKLCGLYGEKDKIKGRKTVIKTWKESIK